MMHANVSGHRQHSITHRAVQRLRELCPEDQQSLGDETIRDRLDDALSSSREGGRAVQTLDAMLGEPQTLIPVEGFGNLMYAIVKEDTVVTVLPQSHGEEIIARGQAMEQRVASGEARLRPSEKRQEPVRRWQEAPRPVVVERARASTLAPAPPAFSPGPERIKSNDPVTAALEEALSLGRRKAAIAALQEAIQQEGHDAQLLPLCNAMARYGVLKDLTVGDIVEAAKRP